MSLSKWHLGSGVGGEASKNKLKDTSFIFPMKNVTILGEFRTHAQKDNGKVLEMNSTYSLNILALLFFFKFAMRLRKIWSKRRPV